MADEGPRKVKKKSSSGGKPVDKDTAAKKKQLEASIRAQVAAEEKAYRIVEQLVLENSISDDYLLEIGNYITTSHYSDIIEERGIAKVCGYPLCSNALTQVPKQKYKISVKTNRVFDITERKNYCSNFCYKASKYFESQIPTSPVWTRIGESPKKLTLLKVTDLSFKPSPGELMVGSEKLEHHYLRSEKEQIVEKTCNADSIKTSSDENNLHDTFSNTHLDDESDGGNHSTAHSTKKTIDKEDEVTSKLNKLAISTNSKSIKDNKIANEQHKEDTDWTNKFSFPSHSEKNEEKSFDKNEKESLQKIQQEKHILRTEESGRNAKELFLNTIKDILIQWFTDSTYRYLNMVSFSSVNVDTLEDVSGTQPDVLEQNEAQNCSDKTLRFQKTDKKPGDVDDESNGAGDGDDKNQTEKQLNPENMKIIERNTDTEEGFPCVVPPIDSKSQLTIRRQIVLQKLAQVIPEVIVTTPYNKSELVTHFTALVKTFSLESRNTMFKPLQWKVLATTLIHLLEKHRGLKGDNFSSDNRKKMLVNLGLTIEDMDNIMDSISMTVKNTTKFGVPSEDAETRQEHSAVYSRMEDLD